MNGGPRPRSGPEDQPTAAEIAAQSGLEFLQGVLDGRYPAPPICAPMNYRLVEVAPGRAVFRGAPRFELMNPIGSIHGGWYGTLLDSCMSCAVQTMLPKGRLYTTLDYSVTLLRPLFADSPPVEAVGTAIHVGRRAGTAEGRIVGTEDGKLYATGTASCIVFEHSENTV